MMRRGRLTRIGVAALLFVFLLAACGKPGPKAVAQDFYEAFERHEFSKAKKYACDSLHDELDVWISEVGNKKIDVQLDVVFKETQKEDERAWMTVRGTKRVAGQIYTVDYELRIDKNDGDWEVCDMRDRTR